MATTSQVHADTVRQNRAATVAIAISNLEDRPHPDSLLMYGSDAWSELLTRAGVDPTPYVPEALDNYVQRKKIHDRRAHVVAAYRAGYEQPRGDAAFDFNDETF